MAAKYSRAVQKELMKKEIEQNPEIADIRRRILALMIVWIVSRVAVTAVEIVGSLAGIWDFQATNLTGIALMAIFAAGVYAGERWAGILPIIGGGAMLVQWVIYGYLYIMISNEYYTVARIYAALFLLASLVQIGIFVYIVLNKRITALFDANKRSVSAAQRKSWSRSGARAASPISSRWKAVSFSAAIFPVLTRSMRAVFGSLPLSGVGKPAWAVRMTSAADCRNSALPR